MTIEGKHILQLKYELIENRSEYAHKLWNITMDLNNKVINFLFYLIDLLILTSIVKKISVFECLNDIIIYSNCQ